MANFKTVLARRAVSSSADAIYSLMVIHISMKGLFESQYDWEDDGGARDVGGAASGKYSVAPCGGDRKRCLSAISHGNCHRSQPISCRDYPVSTLLRFAGPEALVRIGKAQTGKCVQPLIASPQTKHQPSCRYVQELKDICCYPLASLFHKS
jgi:hypothetical protein